MKRINNLLIIFSALLLLGACENDGDKYFLSTPTENELIASSDAVVLTEATAKLYALSFAWTERTLQISDPVLKAPDVLKTALEVSLNEDFSGTIVESTESGLSKSYTGATLNIVANTLGATPNVATPFYFRLKGTTGNNMEPVYSNVEKVNVTSYELDMRFGNILDQNAQDTNLDLFSTNSNRIYTGFIGATSWMNFLFQEADGTIWRTANSSDIGKPFIITSEGTWGIWFPNPAGCYYVNFDIPAKQWTALLLPSLTVNGIEGITMTYNRSTNQWQGTFTATEAGDITIQISGTGKQYDHTTVTGNDNAISDELAKDTPFAFNGNSNGLTFGTTSSDITVNVPQAGECTLTIDLSNPQQWTAAVTAGGSSEPTYPATLAIYSAETSPQFLTTLTPTGKEEEEGTFQGVFQMKTGWENFKIADTEGSIWYGPVDGSPQSLVAGSDWSFWFDQEALESFMITASLRDMTWTPTKISQINICGGFNNWSLTSDVMTYNAGTQTWSATCNISNTENGFYFLLNQNWDWSLKGSTDGLYLAPSAGDGSYIPAEAGTYLITLDIRTMTFTMDKQN